MALPPIRQAMVVVIGLQNQRIQSCLRLHQSLNAGHTAAMAVNSRRLAVFLDINWRSGLALQPNPPFIAVELSPFGKQHETDIWPRINVNPQMNLRTLAVFPPPPEQRNVYRSIRPPSNATSAHRSSHVYTIFGPTCVHMVTKIQTYVPFALKPSHPSGVELGTRASTRMRNRIGF